MRGLGYLRCRFLRRIRSPTHRWLLRRQRCCFRRRQNRLGGSSPLLPRFFPLVLCALSSCSCNQLVRVVVSGSIHQYATLSLKSSRPFQFCMLEHLLSQSPPWVHPQDVAKPLPPAAANHSNNVDCPGLFAGFFMRYLSGYAAHAAAVPAVQRPDLCLRDLCLPRLRRARGQRRAFTPRLSPNSRPRAKSVGSSVGVARPSSLHECFSASSCAAGAQRDD